MARRKPDVELEVIETMAPRSTDRFGPLDKWRLLRLIYSDPFLTQNAKVAAFWLLEHFNGKTHQCYPKQATLAKEMGKSESSVKRAVKELIAACYFTKPRQGGRNKGSNHYRPCFHLIGRGSEPPPGGGH